jgi:hypothetical protein
MRIKLNRTRMPRISLSLYFSRMSPSYLPIRRCGERARSIVRNTLLMSKSVPTLYRGETPITVAAMIPTRLAIYQPRIVFVPELQWIITAGLNTSSNESVQTGKVN